jgi:hypothetical protein
MSEEIIEYVPSYPWERQKDEDWKHYEWFCKWRDSTPKERRITIFSRAVGSSPVTIKKVMEANVWVKRFEAYKIKLLEEKQELDAVEREDMCMRHSALSIKLQEKLNEAIDNIDAATLSPKDIVSWLDVAVKVERLSKGESTKNIEEKRKVDVTVAGKSNIVDDPQKADMACALLEQLTLGKPIDQNQYNKLLENKNE